MTEGPEEKNSSHNQRKHVGKKTLIASLVGMLFLVANVGMGVKHHINFKTPNTPMGIAYDVMGIPWEWYALFARQIRANKSLLIPYQRRYLLI